MNFSELQDEVSIKLQDNSTDITDRIGDWINEIVDIALEEADIPGLKSFTTVDTVLSQAYANLPSTCSGKVLYVGNGDEKFNVITLEELLEDYPDMAEVGDVEAVAVEGNLLYYQKIPSPVETLVLLFKRNAVDMVDSTDVPDTIPAFLHRDVIVCGAAMLGFDLIEDGVEEEKVNTRAQSMQYRKGIIKLSEFGARRRKHMSRSVWRY